MDLQYKKGEIYYANLTQEIGCEIFGMRPVLIISNDIGNANAPSVIIASISTAVEKNLPTHVFLNEKIMPQACVVKCEMIMTIDKARLDNYVTTLDDKRMKKIYRAMILCYFF